LGALKDIAGVNMRLNAGGVRELPWHKAAESSAFRLDRMLRHQSMTEALGYFAVPGILSDARSCDFWRFSGAATSPMCRSTNGSPLLRMS
jgi:hypothetical protein